MPQTPLIELLRLTSPPVAIAFVEQAPQGVPHVSGMEPAGCGYWRRAAAGEVFFTVADDHKRCPVGAHTHNVPLSPAEQQELMGLVQTMVGLSYLKIEDVPQIPTRRICTSTSSAARTGSGRPSSFNTPGSQQTIACIGRYPSWS